MKLTRHTFVRIVGVPALCAFIALAAGCNISRRAEDLGEAKRETSARQIQKAAELVREAQRYELKDDEKTAIDKYRQAIIEYNELPVAWNNLGRLLMKRSDNLGAAEAFKTASELSPTDPTPLHNLGALWESLGYLDDASKWYDQALQRDDNYLPSLRRYLLVQELQNKFDPVVGERLKKAMLAEMDPWWLNRYKRMYQRFEEARQATGSMDSGSR